MDVTWIEEAGGFGMIPDGFDPSRETPQTADRDSEGPARLAELFREMDALSAEMRTFPELDGYMRLAASARTMLRTWDEIRREMGK